jgi:hypothetical protein
MKCNIFCSVIFQSKKHILRKFMHTAVHIQYTVSRENILKAHAVCNTFFPVDEVLHADMCRKCLLRYCK